MNEYLKLEKRLKKIRVETLLATSNNDLPLALKMINRLVKIISHRELHTNITLEKMNCVLVDLLEETKKTESTGHISLSVIAEFGQAFSDALRDHKDGHKQSTNLSGKPSGSDGLDNISPSGKRKG